MLESLDVLWNCYSWTKSCVVANCGLKDEITQEVLPHGKLSSLFLSLEEENCFCSTRLLLGNSEHRNNVAAGHWRAFRFWVFGMTLPAASVQDRKLVCLLVVVVGGGQWVWHDKSICCLLQVEKGRERKRERELGWENQFPLICTLRCDNLNE